jgi:hypothetical protein
MAATRTHPVAEANARCLRGLALRPGENAKFSREFTGSSYQGEPLGDTPNLAICAGRDHPVGQWLSKTPDLCSRAVTIADQPLKEGMGGGSIIPLGCRHQFTRKGVAVGLTVNGLEKAEAGARIRRDVDNANTLTGHRPSTSTIFRHLVSERYFPCRKKQHAPGR